MPEKPGNYILHSEPDGDRLFLKLANVWHSTSSSNPQHRQYVYLEPNGRTHTALMYDDICPTRSGWNFYPRGLINLFKSLNDWGSHE